jgi:hemerythrin superfamily protein
MKLLEQVAAYRRFQGSLSANGVFIMATKSAPKSKSTTKSSAPSQARPKKGSRTTRRTATASKRPQDAIALLKADHKEVDAMFKAYEKTDDDAEKQELATKICKALTVHAQIEEEIFYPAAYDAFDEEGDDLVDEAQVEHASAKALIAEIEAMQVGEPLFDAKVKVLGEYIKHHVEEEETEMFPECRDAGMDLKALGQQLLARKEELMANT